jgi:hypothetical protein
VSPEETLTRSAHTPFRHAEPKHQAGSQARHAPKSLQAYASRRPTQPINARAHEPATGAQVPLTAPAGLQPVPPRHGHLLPHHSGNLGVAGPPAPVTRPNGERIPMPSSHREAIHHPVTAHEAMRRKRERT